MMKKVIILISAILITLTIITILVIKNITGRITGIAWYTLINLKIDDEEKVQIIKYPESNIADASSITYYNFEFDKKIVLVLNRRDSYMPGNTGSHYYKYKYELTDEEITYIKDKIEKINEINDEEINHEEINHEELTHEELVVQSIIMGARQKYSVITIHGEKFFQGNDEAKNLIKDIINITYKKEMN